MGLDMYLSAKKYIGVFEESDKTLSKNISLIAGVPGAITINEVSGEVGYWRKANAIHGWFVHNVQDGADDCRSYYVSREHLTQLKAECQQVLDNPDLAKTVLPATKGFFFGGYDYDQYYFDDLKYTIDIVDSCLRLPDEWSFEYSASW